MVRPPHERKAMGRLARRRIESHDGRWLTRSCWAALHACAHFCMGSVDDNHGVAEKENEEEEGREAADESPQFTLKSKRRVTQKSCLPFLALRQKLCFCCSRSTMTSDEYDHDGTQYLFFLDINNFISKYLSWSFRTSYFKLLGVFAIFYYVNILVFTLVYYVISVPYPMCINSNGSQMGVRMFGDCFHMSWTTFSTVGYGLIYPATGASDFFVPTGCVGVGVLGSLESFMGVLYAGFCSAIVFGKVLRTQNHAQVYFSDPIVIRFGSELSDRSSHNASEHIMAEEAKEELDEEEGGEGGGNGLIMAKMKQKDIPCPSLEFRLVNRLHDVPSGEIVEAKLTCVAILDPKLSKQNNDTPPDNNNSDMSPAGQLKVNDKTTIGELAKVIMDNDSRRANRHLDFHSTDSKQPHMFTKISLDADEHPYFRRVWFGRHRLDQNSPLLTPAARNQVKLAGGYWPADMNNYQSIKSSLQFRHILVSISGTANANAASVYAQKVYDLVDVNVGYRFVPMNYHSDEGLLKTDPYLLNAVYQQRGGGAEPFH